MLLSCVPVWYLFNICLQIQEECRLHFILTRSFIFFPCIPLLLYFDGKIFNRCPFVVHRFLPQVLFSFSIPFSFFCSWLYLNQFFCNLLPGHFFFLFLVFKSQCWTSSPSLLLDLCQANRQKCTHSIFADNALGHVVTRRKKKMNNSKEKQVFVNQR